jgi:AcrR family transcriptional regulator
MARQRSARAHEQVLNAALKLFSERGIDGTSMDAIAEASEVSKATIYNHWPDKEALLLEVIAFLHGIKERPKFDSGNTRADLIAVLSHKPPHARAHLQERLWPHLLAYSARNSKFGHVWKSMVMEAPRREIKRILARAIEKGEFSAGLNYDLSLCLLIGPSMYTHVLRVPQGRLRDFQKQVVDAFWKAFALREKPPREQYINHSTAAAIPTGSSALPS